MTAVSIRLLAPEDDLTAIGELTVAAYLTNKGDTDVGYHRELRSVASRARHCPVLVAVSDDDGAVVGTVTYVPGPDNLFADLERGDEAGFRMLAVAPSAQGRGIGRALAIACVDRARAEGRGGIAIYTRPMAVAARALYDSMGFARDPERDWEFEPGEWLWAFVLRFPNLAPVELRDVTDTDLPIFFRQQLDPEATAMADFPARIEADFMAHWTKIRANPTVVSRTILVDGDVAGNIVSWLGDGERDIGYWVGKPFWGRGIATRALTTFLHELTDRPLHAHVARHNVASRRVLAKCGFVGAGEDEDELVLRLDAPPAMRPEAGGFGG